MTDRAVAIAAVALVACGGGDRTGAREAISAVVEAIDRGDRATQVANMVSPKLLESLVTCADDKQDWYLPAGRTHAFAESKARFDAFAGDRIRIESFAPEDPEDWKRYAPGDVIYGACTARRAFAREEYRVELAFDDGFSKTVSNKPLEVWRVGDAVYLWDDPLYADVAYTPVPR